MDGDYKYLKDRSHYERLFDLLLIDKCIEIEKNFTKIPLPKKELDGKKMTEKQIKSKMWQALSYAIYAFVGQSLVNKEETIERWVSKDREKDYKLQNTPIPKGIYCNKCKNKMLCKTRHVEENLDTGELFVIYYFVCKPCQISKRITEDGNESVLEPMLCPNCNAVVKTKNVTKKHTLISTYFCTRCSYKDIEELDISEKYKAETEAKENEKIKFFKKRYNISDELRDSYINVKQVQEMFKAQQEKQQKPETTVLNIIEVKEKIKSLVEKEQYIDISFEKPDISKDVIISFGAIDSKKDRGEYDSIHTLQKIIKTSLEGTNWKLMSDGIRYRLGYVTGRIRGAT